MCSTADRLKEIMDLRGFRQVDILDLCKPYCAAAGIKLGRSDLSQYISGKVAPRQDKLSILAQALNVSEAWLMGFDVPMNRPETMPRVEPGQIFRRRFVAQLETAEQICRDGAEVIFDAYKLAPDKMTDYARMICLTSGDRRHLATAAHTDADRIPQEDLDQLDD